MEPIEPRAMLEEVDKLGSMFAKIRTCIGEYIYGQNTAIQETLITLLSGGHVLLVGVPGLGKTRLVEVVGFVFGLDTRRVQFTPDLMPADIVGTNLVVENPEGGKAFELQHGPIFAHLILADEINRATPKTQSAMLEAMQEQCVTAGGASRQLDQPFFVLATQNPIDQEGTYPLPEAQLDRFFFKLLVGYPSASELKEVIRRTTEGVQSKVEPVMDGETIVQYQQLVRQVPVPEHVKDYAVRLVLATHPQTDTAAPISSQYLRFGSSPRGAQTLIVAAKVRALTDGRFNVSFEDIEASLHPTLRHRLILNFEAEAEGITTDHVLDAILAHTERQPALEGQTS